MRKSNGRLGTKLTEETKEKMRLAAIKRGKNSSGHTGHKHSEETKLKISSKKIGTVPWNYITDRTKLKDKDRDRKGPLHRDWSRSVKNRDGWKCQLLDQNCSGRMESHHIFSWTTYPNLRYEINNGITLCHAHHPRKRAEEKRYIPIFLGIIANHS